MYNDPTGYFDPDGEGPLATGLLGGTVGALVGAGIALYEGKKGMDVLKSAGTGFVGGFIVGSGAGLLKGTALFSAKGLGVTLTSGSLSGLSSSITSEFLEYGTLDNLSTNEIVWDGVIGAAANLGGALLSKAAEPIINKAVSGINSKLFSSDGFKAFEKGFRKELRKSGFSKKEINKRVKEALNALSTIVQKGENGVRVVIQTGGKIVIEYIVQETTKEADEKTGD